MKKTIVTFILVLSIQFISQAQVRFGIKGGVNLSNMVVTLLGVSVSGNNQIGGQVGGVLDYSLSDKVSIQPNILFSMKGARGVSSSGSSTNTTNLNLNYVEVPVNIMYKINETFSVGAGPYIGFGMGNNFKNNSIKTTDFGFNVAASYEFAENLVASINYSNGLSNIGDSNALSSSGISLGDFAVKNKVIGLSLIKFFGSID